MNSANLTTLEIEPQGKARFSVIWMHGLGADAHDFEPIVRELKLPEEAGIRFVFPNAPVRPVTINGGMAMRAWYDILSMDLPRLEDEPGVNESETAIRALVENEDRRGIAPERVLLAGFSQGGAMALHTALRYPDRLAGILALSCYVPLAGALEQQHNPNNLNLPIFLAHGTQDGVIPINYGRAAADRLVSLGYRPEWHEYNMAHEVCLNEIGDIAAWLKRIVA
jgi:phospholipase/carboxylesterase